MFKLSKNLMIGSVKNVIKMHCDRCDDSCEVRWTDGKNKGQALAPPEWGEVPVPEIGSKLPDVVVYMLCPKCIDHLHNWITADMPMEENAVVSKIR